MMTLKNLFIGLLTLSLVGSLVLNHFFYKRAFIPLQSARLDPIGLEYYPSTEAPVADSGKPSVMFYGDSRALSWPTYATPDYDFINRAIGNQTSTQIVQRFDAHVVPLKPQLILIQMCVNDLKMIPLFPEKQNDILQDCKDNIQLLIKKAHKIDAKVILSTVFPLGHITVLRKALGAQAAPTVNGISSINNFIKTQAADNVLIFDSYALLVGGNSTIKPEYSRDWLHLNAEGYQHLNKHFIPFLDNIIKGDPQ